jgi:hypothetical protein
MNKEGKRIEKIDAKEAIRKHQETAEWEYREEAAFWYAISKTMDERFFNGLVYPDGRKVPPPVIAFEDLRNRTTIAQYHLFPDEYGTIGRITFNTVHYIDKVTDDNKLVKSGSAEDILRVRLYFTNIFIFGSRSGAILHIGHSTSFLWMWMLWVRNPSGTLAGTGSCPSLLFI